MKILQFKKYFLSLALLGAFVALPVACSSDDPDDTEQPVTLTPDPTNANTTIEATSPVVADGTATSTVTVKIADENGTALTTSAGAVTLSSTGAAVISAVTDGQNGSYTATVTNTTAEEVTISGTLSGTEITDTATISFTEAPDAIGEADATNENTTIDASAPTAASGVSSSTITIQLADANGNDLVTSGGDIVIIADPATAEVSEVTDNGDGTYTATVTNTAEETTTISATLDGTALANTTSITFNPDDSNPAFGVDESDADLTTLTSLLRINSGGPEVTLDDKIFIADQYFDATGTSAFTNELLDEIDGTDDDALYLTERVTADNAPSIKGPFSYNIPATNGTYTVVLYFAEIYWGVDNPQGFEGDEGRRIFDISMEGSPIFTGYDLVKEVGPATASSKVYDVTVEDGELNITFEATINKPKISGIEIYGASTATVGN